MISIAYKFADVCGPSTGSIATTSNWKEVYICSHVTSSVSYYNQSASPLPKSMVSPTATNVDVSVSSA